jgi:hypothetical protein
MRTKTMHAARTVGRWIERFLEVSFPVNVACGRRTR